jgi:hypothetical protein
MNVKEILFRCSSLGHLMTEPKLKADKEAGNLSEGTKTHCVDVFASWYYGRREDAYSKYLEKGNAVEEDAVTLLSLETKNLYFKNEENLRNEYISGTPDLFLKDDKGNIEVVEDIKSSWDIFTFLRTQHKELNSLYYWQLQGYMWLTGASKAKIRYCLVNSTSDLIESEKRKTAYQMNLIDADADPAYVERCKQIERNMIYDIELFKSHYPYYQFHNDVNEWSWDIPRNERLFTFDIERSDEDIQKIQAKVIKARIWIENKLIPTTLKNIEE